MTGWRLFMTGYFCLSAVNLSWAKNMNRQSAILSRVAAAGTIATTAI
jgi:hypothetical protein